MSEPAPALIELKGVSLAVEGRAILSGIDLRTRARRIGIVGRNGSGKTTLARVMAGLLVPDAGAALIDSIAVAKDRKAALRHVGILFQNPDHQIIFPTVEEEIGFGLKQAGQSAAEVAAGVAAILAQFDRGHWAKAAIHQLSQGQKQLVCLMAVLVMRPRVIILDEPFSGLDIPTTRQLERVLAGLAQTLVQITHDPAAVQGYDQVLWVQEGQIRREGAAAEVLAAYRQQMETLGAGDDLTDLTG